MPRSPRNRHLGAAQARHQQRTNRVERRFRDDASGGNGTRAQIIRDGTASTLSVPSHVLNQTTAYVDGFTVTSYNYGMTVNLSNGTIECPVNGIYSLWGDYLWGSSAGSYGVALSFAVNDVGKTAGQVPYDCRSKISGDNTYQSTGFVGYQSAGDLIGLSVGQNSGSTVSVDKLATLVVVLLQEL